MRRLETVLEVRGELLCFISYQLLKIQNFIQSNLDYPDLLGTHEIVRIIEDPDTVEPRLSGLVGTSVKSPDNRESG